MPLSPQDKKAMQQAKERIQSRDYRGALVLIERIDHPTAEKWRHQLQSRIEDDDFGDPFAENQASKAKATKTDTPKRKRGRLYIVIGLLVVVIVLFLAAVPDLYENVILDATDLQVYDSRNSSAASAAGDQWLYDNRGGFYTLTAYTTSFTSASETLSTPTLNEVSQHATNLIIRCTSNKYEAFITADSRVQIVDNYILVGLIFDDDPAQTVSFHPSQSGDAAFFREESLPALFTELSQSGELLVQMPTLSGLHRNSLYDVSGFNNVVGRLEQQCGALPK